MIKEKNLEKNLKQLIKTKMDETGVYLLFYQ